MQKLSLILVITVLFVTINPNFGTSKTTPVQGGRILFGSIGEPSNLIPYLATDSASGEVTGQIFTALLEYDKNLNIVPLAAQSYEVLDNGKRLRFVLRDDIVWQDGTKLTVEDVAFTYKFMIDPKTPTAYAQDYLAVHAFTITGKNSFEVVYKEPFARALLTWMGAILPKHLLEGEDLSTTPFARKPVGAGPFALKEWESGRGVTLEASDTYFKGRPYLDQLIFRIIPDLSTMFLELKAGRLDSMSLTPQQYFRQTKGPVWDEHWNKYRYLSFSYTFLGFNFKHPFFKDVLVRRAISHALDRNAIISGVLMGQGVPAFGPYKPETWPYHEGLAPMAYDPKKASELLAKAGWRKGEDGFLEKDGQRFAFTILVNQGNDQRIKSAIIIQSQLKDVGIDVQIRTVEWAAFIKEFVNKGRFDTVLLGWTIVQDPDSYDVWHSSAAFEGGLNFIGYKNAEVDALLEEARATSDRAVRKRLYDRFQEVLHKDQPYCFLFVPYALPIVQKKYKGIEPAPAGIMYNLDRWWVPKLLQ